MSTTTNLSTLKINYLTQSQFDTTLDNNQINENEIYLTPTEDMTAQEISDFINSLNGYGTIADLVVEQGTEGLWDYRKWNSGVYEAWYRPVTSTSIASYTTQGGFYGYSQHITFPSVKPVDGYYIVLAEWWIDSGFAWHATTLSKDTTGFTVYALANVSGTHNTLVSCYVKGRWK